MPKDPRWFQIVFLSSLLGVGLFWRDFQISPLQVLATFAAGLGVQAFFLRRLGIDGIGYRSAAISCLSLCLLLRSDTIWAHPLCSAVATAGKFLLRARGKHLFNPGNLGVVLGLLTGHAWASPAQWGHDVLFAAWFVLLGATVVWRAARQDVSWAFLAFYLGLVLCRVLWLGQRNAVFWHQFENGSLLLFSFFMISDPKTIPDARPARFLLAALAASMAFTWQYGLFRYNGLFYALFVLTPMTYFLDRLFEGRTYRWNDPHRHGGLHETTPLYARLAAGIAAR